MNVAYHLNKLGLHPVLLTRIGHDERGGRLLDILREQNLDTSHLQTDPSEPTGIVYARANAQGEMAYEIVQPAAWDNIEPDAGIRQQVSEADYFVFGSLATRAEKSRNTLMSLLELAQNKVLDINLRAPFYDRQIIEELLKRADVVKMNLEELELITGWFSRFTDTEERMQLIQDRFAVRSVIVTKGGDGAVVNYRGSYYQHAGYKVKVADTIGSGDAFLAAFLYKVLRDESPEDTLAFAAALGALVASKSGGWPDYNLIDIRQIIQSIK